MVVNVFVGHNGGQWVNCRNKILYLVPKLFRPTVRNVNHIFVIKKKYKDRIRLKLLR